MCALNGTTGEHLSAGLLPPFVSHVPLRRIGVEMTDEAIFALVVLLFNETPEERLD